MKFIHQFKAHYTSTETQSLWELTASQHNCEYKLWTSDAVCNLKIIPMWVADMISKSGAKGADTLIGAFLLYEFGGCYVFSDVSSNNNFNIDNFDKQYVPFKDGLIYSHKSSNEISEFIVRIETDYLKRERNLNQDLFDRKIMRNQLYSNNSNNLSHTYSHKFTSIPSMYQALDGILINSDKLLSKSEFSSCTLQPYCYLNGSICEYKGRLLFAYRMECLESTKNPQWFQWISLGLNELDKNTFEPSLRFRCQIKLNVTPKFIPSAVQGKQRNNIINNDHFEDPRLFTLDNGKELWLCFTNGYEIGFAQLFPDFKKNKVTPKTQFICSSPGEKSMDKDRREKNWTPFDRNGQLWVHYQLSPEHIIYQLDKKTGDVIQKIKHDTPSSMLAKEINLFGSIRGGTPAIPLNHKYDITIFHSNKKYFGSNYYYYTAGLILFERSTYKIVYCSDVLIRPSCFPNLIPRPSQSAVVFPAGLTNDGTHLTVSYGINDFDNCILKFDINKIIPAFFLSNN
jgi:hypothetical protein